MFVCMTGSDVVILSSREPRLRLGNMLDTPQHNHLYKYHPGNKQTAYHNRDITVDRNPVSPRFKSLIKQSLFILILHGV